MVISVLVEYKFTPVHQISLLSVCGQKLSILPVLSNEMPAMAGNLAKCNVTDKDSYVWHLEPP